jgi:hypothetical protein
MLGMKPVSDGGSGALYLMLGVDLGPDVGSGALVLMLGLKPPDLWSETWS